MSPRLLLLLLLRRPLLILILPETTIGLAHVGQTAVLRMGRIVLLPLILPRWLHLLHLFLILRCRRRRSFFLHFLLVLLLRRGVPCAVPPIAVGLGRSPVSDSVISVTTGILLFLGLHLLVLLGLRLLRFFHTTIACITTATASFGGHLLGSGRRLGCGGGDLGPVPGDLAGVDVVIIGSAGIGIGNFLPSWREGRWACCRIGSGRVGGSSGGRGIVAFCLLGGGLRLLLPLVRRGLLLLLLLLLRVRGGLASIIRLLLGTILLVLLLLLLLLLLVVVARIVPLLLLRLLRLLAPLLLLSLLLLKLLRTPTGIWRLPPTTRSSTAAVRRRRRRNDDRGRQEGQSVPLEPHGWLIKDVVISNWKWTGGFEHEMCFN